MTSPKKIVGWGPGVESENGTRKKIQHFEKPLRRRRVESLNGEELGC
jgi:hypothetical protein